MIRVVELSKAYGGVQALDGLSLEVPRGTVFGLLGPNGAGKTTFLKVVMEFLMPDQGEVERQVPYWHIGYLPERALYPAELRIDGYLRLVGRLAGLRGGALRAEVELRVQQVGLEGVARQQIGASSRGVLQRVGIAQALVGSPPLLLLDEPASNLDPQGQRRMRDLILDLRAAGTTVLVSSHRLDEVTRICSHVAILRAGRLARVGPLADVLAPRDEVLIETAPLRPAVAAALGTLATEIADGRIWLRGDAVARKADVLRLLLDEGIEINGLTQERASLEEVYLEAVGG